MRRYLFVLSLLLFVFVVAGCDKLIPAGPSPVITAFFADAPTVKVGGTGTVLHWETSNGDTATIVPLVGSVPLSGARAVTPTATTTYTLTIVGKDGLRQASGTVTVTVVP